MGVHLSSVCSAEEQLLRHFARSMGRESVGCALESFWANSSNFPALAIQTPSADAPCECPSP